MRGGHGVRNNQGRGRGARTNQGQYKEKKQIQQEQLQLSKELERQLDEEIAKFEAEKIASKLPLEKRVSKIKNFGNISEVPDISPHWKQSFGFISFFPEDNDKDDIINYLNTDLSTLLRLEYKYFWSQVVYDPSLILFLETYLRYARREYEIQESGYNTEVNRTPAQKLLFHRVFHVLMRITTPTESDLDFMSTQFFLDLIGKNGLVDIPKILDICTLYHNYNRDILPEMVRRLFNLQPNYQKDLKISLRIISEVLENLRKELYENNSKITVVGPERKDGSVSEIPVPERKEGLVSEIPERKDGSILEFPEGPEQKEGLVSETPEIPVPPRKDGLVSESPVPERKEGLVSEIPEIPVPARKKDGPEWTEGTEVVGVTHEQRTTYLVDILSTLCSFLEVYPEGGVIFMEMGFLKLITVTYDIIFEKLDGPQQKRKFLILENFLILGEILVENYFKEIQNIKETDKEELKMKFQNFFEIFKNLTEPKNILGKSELELYQNVFFGNFLKELHLRLNFIEKFKKLKNFHYSHIDNKKLDTLIETYGDLCGSDDFQLSPVSLTMQQKINQVKEVVNESTEFITKCLEYYGGNIETVINNILENSLPLELTTSQKRAPKAPTKYTLDQRKNVFDYVNIKPAKNVEDMSVLEDKSELHLYKEKYTDNLMLDEDELFRERFFSDKQKKKNDYEDEPDDSINQFQSFKVDDGESLSSDSDSESEENDPYYPTQDQLPSKPPYPTSKPPLQPNFNRVPNQPPTIEQGNPKRSNNFQTQQPPQTLPQGGGYQNQRGRGKGRGGVSRDYEGRYEGRRGESNRQQNTNYDDEDSSDDSEGHKQTQRQGQGYRQKNQGQGQSQGQTQPQGYRQNQGQGQPQGQTQPQGYRQKNQGQGQPQGQTQPQGYRQNQGQGQPQDQPQPQPQGQDQGFDQGQGRGRGGRGVHRGRGGRGPVSSSHTYAAKERKTHNRKEQAIKKRT